MYAHCSWTLPVLFKPLMCIFLHIFTFEKRAHILECSYAFVAHEVRWWQRYGHVARNSLSQNNCQFHFCRNLSYRDMHMAGGPLVVHAFFPSFEFHAPNCSFIWTLTITMKKRLWLWLVDVAKTKKSTDNPCFDDDAPSVTCLFKICVVDVLTSGTPFYVSLVFLYQT
jgi:hypothetical protein